MRFGIRDERCDWLVGVVLYVWHRQSVVEVLRSSFFSHDSPRPEVSGFFWVLSSIVQNELERGLDPVS